MFGLPLRLSVIAGIALIWMLTLLISYYPTLELHFQNPDKLVESYDFEATDEEAECFRNVEAPPQSPIPKVVHFLWGFGNNPEMTLMNYLAIRSALISIKPDTIKLHYEELNRENIWFQQLEKVITLVHHNMTAEYNRQIEENCQVPHLTDILRLDILHKEGGIYLDTDMIALHSFDNLLQNPRDVILGHEGGDRHGLCNAIILARPKAAFLAQWIDEYGDFDPKEWNYHSVLLPKVMAENQPGEICTLAPSVFFWPTYTRRHIRYMHKNLDKKDVFEVENLLGAYGGSLYSNQLAYHAWSQVARKEYLNRLTPEHVRQKNTRFNMMVRRFL